MNNSKFLHRYTLPDVYSILVVDDKVNDDNAANRNCFEACIKAAIAEKNSKCDVLIDYAASIDKGFEKWTKGSYDLVLIDYDFSGNKKLNKEELEEKDTEDFSMSEIFSEKQGVELFRIIRQVRDESKSYNYRKNFQEVYLWTSHRLKIDNGMGVKLELKGEEEDYYINKSDTGPSKILDLLIKIKQAQKPSTTDKETTYIQFILERLLFLYKNDKNKYNLQGYVALEKAGNKDATSYSSLIKNVPLYLLPYQPNSEKFHWIALEHLKKTLLKELYSKLTDEKLERQRAFCDKDIESLKKHEDKDNKVYSGAFFNKPDKTQSGCKKTTFAGIDFESDIWLAATPLTMVSCVGGEERVFGLLKNKLRAFFDIGIGAAVLKTTYFESDGIGWSHDHIQRHHRTRVFTHDLKNKYQFWNTGKTKLEAFPPQMLNKFLCEVKNELWADKIIVSLGMKPTDDEMKSQCKRMWYHKWNDLLEKVFVGIESKKFPLVEINVRHFLRPLLKSYLDGDEYLAPLGNKNIENYNELYPKVFEKYTVMLQAIHDAGIALDKKIILKFPFRSDIIPFLMIAQKISSKGEGGIKGVTLINAAKSPYPYDKPYKMAGNKVEDLTKIPQMSGELLAWLRNHLIYKLSEIDFKLDVSASGGVGTNNDDIAFLRSQKLVKSIQIGTMALKDIRKLKGDNTRTSFDKLSVDEDNRLEPRIVHLLKDKCIGCGNCYNSYYCDAYLNRGVKGGELPFIDVKACTGCGLCVQLCKDSALEMMPADKYVILCSPFSESMAFILRENGIPFMFMEIGRVSGAKVAIDEIQKIAQDEATRRAEDCYNNAWEKNLLKDEINPLEKSIFLGVKTCVLGSQSNKSSYEILDTPLMSADVKASLNKYKKFKAVTAISLKKGNQIKKLTFESKDFVLLEYIKKMIDEYSPHGVNKAGGIDILGHGELLFGDLSDREEDISIFAGLPLKAIEIIEGVRKK